MAILQGQMGYFLTSLFLPPVEDLRDRNAPEYLREFNEVLRPDIRKRKVQIPVVVHRDGEKLRVIDGWTRILAALLEGVEEIPAIVYPAPLTKGESRLASFQANAKRLDMTVAERARFYAETMVANGWTKQSQLVQALSLSKYEVSRTLKKYTDLPPEIMKDVGGLIPSRAGDVLVKLKGHPDKMHEFADQMRNGIWCVEGLESEVNDFLDQVTGKKPKKTKPRTYKHGGITLSVPGDLTDEQAAAQLAELLKKIKKAS